MKYIILFFINFISLDVCYSSDISDVDLKIIKYADVYSGSKVIVKLENIYKTSGKDAIKPAIPAVSERFIAMLDIHEKNNSLNDAEGEYLLSLLGILSVSGDINAKSALLRAMISRKIAGLAISQGLMKLGPSILPEIKVFLDDKNEMIVGKTISTLKDIAEADSAEVFISKSEKTEFKMYLLNKINNFSPTWKFFIIDALGYYGDYSIIKNLEEIKNKDNFNKDGVYINKLSADSAINIIKKRYRNEK